MRGAVRLACYVMAAGLLVAAVKATADGVGPTAGTTAQDRAGTVHALNNGQSKANGIECPASSLTIVWDTKGQPFCDPSGTNVDISGGGLQPGSLVVLNLEAPKSAIVGVPAGNVGPDGIFSGSVFIDPEPRSTAWATGTAADGSAATSNTLTCTPCQP